MSHPKVSVMVSTFRPGGLDITLAGMRDQTYRDFELVIVDRRYELRHDHVMDLAWEYGIGESVIHVPEHRRNGKWTTICSAWNTAIAVARGEYCIFLQDFAYCPPGWIEGHLSAHDQPGRIAICPYVYTSMPALGPLKKPFEFASTDASDECTEPDAVIRGEVFDEMFIFADGPFTAAFVLGLEINSRHGEDVRTAMRPQPTAVEDSWVHLKNESLLREHLLAINGLDERLERGKGPADTDVGIRLRAIGLQLWWSPGVGYHVAPNARVLCKTMPYGNLNASVEGRWSLTGEGMRYNGIRVAEIGAATDKRAAARAKNNYDLVDLAQTLEPWRAPDARPQSRDVDDRAYWGQDIWPESP